MSTTTDYKHLQQSVRETVDQIAHEQGERLNVIVTSDFIDSLAEIVYKQMETLALDVENFAIHARRAVINVDDVMLCARRNDDLHDIMIKKRDELSYGRSSRR